VKIRVPGATATLKDPRANVEGVSNITTDHCIAVLVSAYGLDSAWVVMPHLSFLSHPGEWRNIAYFGRRIGSDRSIKVAAYALDKSACNSLGNSQRAQIGTLKTCLAYDEISITLEGLRKDDREAHHPPRDTIVDPPVYSNRGPDVE